MDSGIDHIITQVARVIFILLPIIFAFIFTVTGIDNWRLPTSRAVLRKWHDDLYLQTLV